MRSSPGGGVSNGRWHSSMALRTLQESGNANNNLDCIPKGRVQQSREGLTKLHRQLICGSS